MRGIRVSECLDVVGVVHVFSMKDKYHTPVVEIERVGSATTQNGWQVQKTHLKITNHVVWPFPVQFKNKRKHF